MLNLNQADFGTLTGISLAASFILVIPGVVIVQKLKISHPVVIAVGSAFFVLKFACLTLSEFSAVFYYTREWIISEINLWIDVMSSVPARTRESDEEGSRDKLRECKL